ncbi:MFS transporter [Aerosakkonemataceae cyanobacterium BLCC-F154]|uniref:MFS transporter n=1 Tax=Floridaenema fluviatile BLCC-F154 TaxID=3153640 RepID=A0ABV4Y7Y5_9CYAN
MVAYSNLSSPVESEVITESLIVPESVLVSTTPAKFTKEEIRTSLKASTCDGIFAAIFSSITTGVLLSNLLLQLGATPTQIGMLSSVPMVVNLLQPVGAYISGFLTSRYWYGFWVYGIARSLWLILAIAIAFPKLGSNNYNLVQLTLAIVFASNFLAAFGTASWFSWMAKLVPEKLRGRYFGIRNSAASLVTLIGVPLISLIISAWPGGMLQGYSLLLFFGVIAGLVSLCCQFFMTDVNPKAELTTTNQVLEENDRQSLITTLRFLISHNFFRFLLYFGFWAFAVNVGNPFFNLYLLDNLDINVTWVTVYSSLSAGANLLMLVFWGKLADKIGNRPLLILVGIVVALMPLLWLGTGYHPLCLWLGFPLLHLLSGGVWAAIDLCSNNIQMSVAPRHNQATFFAIASAVAGICGAFGATVGGFLAEQPVLGGLPGIFVLTSGLRLLALLPLVLVWEQRSYSLRAMLQGWRMQSKVVG